MSRRSRRNRVSKSTVVQLAKKPDPVMRRELGAGGVSYIGGFAQTDEYNDKLTGMAAVETYDKMRRTDAQVGALINACRLPPLSAHWSIGLPVSEKEAAKVTKEHIEFAHANLFGRIDFQEFLAHALSCVWSGYSIVEIVYAVEDDNIVLAKLAPRLATTIDKWHTDDNGTLTSIEQYVYKGSSYQSIPIPRNKIALFTYGQEANNYLGNALALDTPIPTPSGWSTMADLKVGDEVYDEGGIVRNVIAVRDFVDRPIYRVTFDNGEQIVADANHQWAVLAGVYRLPKVVTTETMAGWVKAHGSKSAQWAIALPYAIERPNRELPVDPYVLGWWITDGSSEGGVISSKDLETPDLLRQCGHTLHRTNENSQTARYYRIDGLSAQLRSMGLIFNKHIPADYLMASVGQRLSLLQGLMDGDGGVDRFSRCEFYNTDRSLVDSVVGLLASLGIKSLVQWVQPKGNNLLPIARIHFQTDLPVFRLPRKLSKQGKPSLRYRRLFVRGVDPCGTAATRCIETDGPSHLFLCGKTCVPTHNSILRACYKHWHIKDVVYKLDAIRCERFAVGVPKITLPPEYDDALYDMADAIGKNWKGASQSHVVLPSGMELEVVAMKGGETLDLMGTIKHHNEEIAKVGLAQFINLGQTETGSRALGEITTQFFYDAEEGWARSIAMTINRDILWPLMDMNFPGKPRPVVLVDDLGWVGLSELVATIRDAGENYLRPAADLENALRDRLNLPKRPEKDWTEPKPPQPVVKKDVVDVEVIPEDPKKDSEADVEEDAEAIQHSGHEHLATKASEIQTPEESDFWRPLRPSERHVALRQISGMIDDSRDRLLRTMVAARDAWVQSLATQVQEKIKDGPEALLTIDLPDDATKGCLKSMLPVLNDVYAFGADQVRRELRSQDKDVALREEPVEEDDKDELLLALLLLALTKIERKTVEAAQAVALGQFRTVGPLAYGAEDAARLIADVTATAEQEARFGATIAVTEMLNLGRDAAATKLAAQITTCEYSAIMDTSTCINCRVVDGTRVTLGSPEYYDLMPPLRSKAHGTCEGLWRCRCIWVYLKA